MNKKSLVAESAAMGSGGEVEPSPKTRSQRS
jgi:hypothetical protein